MKEKSVLRDTLETTLFVIVFVAVAMLLGYIINPKGDTPSGEIYDSPIEEMLNANDSLKSKINQLDTIKQDEVHKVFSLDNDSTIKLFERLVRE